jgi:hypothetical protein
MRAFTWIWAVALISAAFAAAIPGCSRAKPAEAAPVAVSGRVVNSAGKPITGMLVSLHAQEGVHAGDRPSAPLDRDGRFSLTCIPGRYKVTLAPIPIHHGNAEGNGELAAPAAKRPEPPKGGVPRRYSDAQSSPWDVTIPPEGKELLLRVEGN